MAPLHTPKRFVSMLSCLSVVHLGITIIQSNKVNLVEEGLCSFGQELTVFL